jgi:hypothetical protein
MRKDRPRKAVFFLVVRFSAQETHKEQDQNNDEQDMNQVGTSPSANSSAASSSTPTEEADQPQNEKNNDNCFKHFDSPHSFRRNHIYYGFFFDSSDGSLWGTGVLVGLFAALSNIKIIVRTASPAIP